MSKLDWSDTFIEVLDVLIPAYLYTSIASRNLEELGDETAYVFFSVAKEYYLHGTSHRVLGQLKGATEQDQNLLQDLLEHYILLYENQNLVEMVANRARMIEYCHNNGKNYPDVHINGLMKILKLIDGYTTFNAMPLNVLKRTRMNLAFESIMNGIQKTGDAGYVLPSYDHSKIDMNRVRKVLKRIRTR